MNTESSYICYNNVNKLKQGNEQLRYKKTNPLFGQPDWAVCGVGPREEDLERIICELRQGQGDGNGLSY